MCPGVDLGVAWLHAGPPQGLADDPADEHGGDDQAGHHARDEQVQDGHVGQHAVDDHGNRRRDHQANRAGTGQGAHGHVFVVAALDQFAQGHAAHGGGGGGRRARDSCKDRATDHIDMQQAAGQALHPGCDAAKQRLGQFAEKQNITHQHKQGQGDEFIGIQARPHVLRQDALDGHVAKPLQRHQSGAQQRKANPQAGAQQHQHDHQDKDRSEHHSAAPCPTSRSSAKSGASWMIKRTKRASNASHSMKAPSATMACGIHMGVCITK